MARKNLRSCSKSRSSRHDRLLLLTIAGLLGSVLTLGFLAPTGAQEPPEGAQVPPQSSGQEYCSAPSKPTIALQGSSQSVVLVTVDPVVPDGFTRQELNAGGLGLSASSVITEVYSPEANLPYFYVLFDDGTDWVLRVYCKGPVFKVSEEKLRVDDDPSSGKATELGDWAFALQVSPKHLLVWLKAPKEPKQWHRVEAPDEILAFDLGLDSGKVRTSLVTVSGALTLQRVDSGGPQTIDLKRGPMASATPVEVIDRRTGVYILTPTFGAYYRPAQDVGKIYEIQGGRKLVWRDSFIAGGRVFGVLLLYQLSGDHAQPFQGEVIAIPEDAGPQAPVPFEVQLDPDNGPLEAPRIFVRSDDQHVRRLHGCLFFNSGSLGNRQVKYRSISFQQIGTRFRIRETGDTETKDTIDLQKLRIMSHDGHKERIIYLRDDDSQGIYLSCSLRRDLG